MKAELSTERLVGHDVMAAAVQQAFGSKDELMALGKYKAQCKAVVPKHKAEYDVVFQRYMAAVAKGAEQLARQIEEELHAFPMYVVWEQDVPNTVVTAGKNHLLDNYITGSAFTQVGPYMGLISSVGYTAIAAGDTMVSHGGWTEAGSTNAPTFAARGTPAWSAASAGAKATSSAVSFTMTGAGTLKGCFIVLGSGAVTTLMSTAGTLFSAGLFSGGDQVVANGNVVTVSYSLSV